jgi:hypothetical protein
MSLKVIEALAALWVTLDEAVALAEPDAPAALVLEAPLEVTPGNEALGVSVGRAAEVELVSVADGPPEFCPE